MAGEEHGLDIFPERGTPHVVRPLTAGAVRASIQGLAQQAIDIEQAIEEAARMMRWLTGEEPVPVEQREMFISAMAGTWLSRFGRFVPPAGEAS